MHCVVRLALVVAFVVGAAPCACRAAIQFTGVNLAGADFGESNLPGTYNTHYTYPTAAEVDYFVGKGMNTFRVPFRWERLQPTLNAALDATELARLDTLVNYATAQGATVVLDPHNYARYWVGGRPGGTERVIGSTQLPYSAFTDFWLRLADEYKDNARVVFGLMNEPNTMPTEQWRDAAQAAINAIRSTGATNLILVPGNAWTGAHSWTQNWYGTPNSQAMLSIVDPGENFAFDVHQYLDNDSSGTSATIVSPTIGQERLVQFTNWLHANNRRGFLGEFAVANSQIGSGPTQIGDEAIDNMLDYIEANDDVWLGWTWWAAGPWWGNYMFTLEPTNLGQPNQADRPAMAVLQPHLVVAPPPVLSGDYNDDGAVDAADYVVWRKNLHGTTLINETVTPGIVDEADYAEWVAHFGSTAATSAATATTAAIPEPPTLGGLAMALFAAGRLRWERRGAPAARVA